MDVVLMADTHELHREVDVPFGDLLIHAGDFSMLSRSERSIRDFNEWLGELPHPHKVVVPGNHEFFLEQDPAKRSFLSNATVLINEGMEVEGLKVWGSPVLSSRGGAFGLSDPQDRKRHWKRMGNVDILITHGPPAGILDMADQDSESLGDPQLLEAVQRMPPLLHVYGHVHGGYGQQVIGETHFINCALLGVDGELAFRPVRVRIPRRRLHS